jgi:Domain of unknown function (DUF6249)
MDRAILQAAPIFMTGIIFGFSAVFGIVALVLRYRERQLRHDTIRLALEEGQPVPAELLRDPVGARRTDLSRGIILLSLGAGLSLFLWTAEKRSWGIGLVLVALGLGFIASHALAARGAPPRPNLPDPGPR